MAGVREGMRDVALDGQRELGFGVKLLSDLIREDPECVDAIVELLNEVTPYTAAVFVPPNWDLRYTECFGFTLEEIYTEGAQSFESKLRAMGLPQEALDRITFPLDLPPRERAERGILLLKANILGEKLGPPKQDADAIAAMFDGV